MKTYSHKNRSPELEKLLDKGDCLYDQSEYQEAISYYDKVLGMDPNDVYALQSKGLALKNLGRYEEAISYYDKVLKIDPNDTGALNNKGVALDDLG